MDASSPAAGFHMADVRRKRPTLRRAVAVGELHAGPVGFAALAGKTLPKGDALAMAEALSAETHDAVMQEVTGVVRQSNPYSPDRTVSIPAWLVSEKEAS